MSERPTGPDTTVADKATGSYVLKDVILASMPANANWAKSDRAQVPVGELRSLRAETHKIAVYAGAQLVMFKYAHVGSCDDNGSYL